MRLTFIILSILLLSITNSEAQTQTDSTILRYKEYIQNIILFHPLAKTADLKTQMGEAEWLSAKGRLDPTIDFYWDEKEFDEKNYYRQYRGKFKVPTVLGLEFVGGYENTEGVFLNPENTTDEFGLWNVGIELDVIQGLIVNERKTALDQARVFQDMTANDRRLLLNDLLLNSSDTYLEWQKVYFFQEVLLENIELAENYLENTKISFFNGEKSAIDTLEAYILLQDANNLFQKNEVQLENARQNLENFLWFDQTPLVLRDNVIPESYEEELFTIETDINVSNTVNSHPMVLSYIYKQSYLEIEQRLKREKLKPKLKLKYSPLLATSDTNIAPSFSSSDYKWGFDFTMPLLFRSERADVQLGKIKIQETDLGRQNKSLELENNIQNSLNQQEILRQQIVISEQNREGYRRLLEGENEKFRLGESSVFLLNKRQEKYIEAQLKVIEQNIKLQKEFLKYLYYTDDLF